MFTYYGRKRRLAPKYPAPLHDTIVEPFAGSAAYSLLYWQKNIILIEKDPVVYGVWKYLQNCQPADILKLPMIPHGTTTKDHTWLSEQERHFLGFMIAGGPSRPQYASSIMSTWDESRRQRTANDLHKIKHWDIRHDDYKNVPDIEATWFIDPPYQFGGQHYRISNKLLDFKSLGDWSRARKGQVIVCENTKADWMDFKPFAKMNGQLHKTVEAIWYRETTESTSGYPVADSVVQTPP